MAFDTTKVEDNSRCIFLSCLTRIDMIVSNHIMIEINRVEPYFCHVWQELIQSYQIASWLRLMTSLAFYDMNWQDCLTLKEMKKSLKSLWVELTF